MSAERHPRGGAVIEKLPIALVSDAMLALVESVVDRRLKEIGIIERMTPHALRVVAGMKVEDVAAKSNGAVTGATVSNIERGVSKNPDPNKLNAIADALGCTRKEYRAAVGHLISMRELRAEGE